MAKVLRLVGGHFQRTVQVDDILLLTPLQSACRAIKDVFSVLTPRLQHSTVIPGRTGRKPRHNPTTIPIGKYIGKPLQNLIVHDSESRPYVVREPTLDQYLWKRPKIAHAYQQSERTVLFDLPPRLRRRGAIPPTTQYDIADGDDQRTVSIIPPAEAEYIVGKLNLKSLPDPSLERIKPGSPRAAPIEILECGSGLGALSLTAALAIHPLNYPPPSAELTQAVYQEDRSFGPVDTKDGLGQVELKFKPDERSLFEQYRAYREARGIKLSSVDMYERHQAEARRTVRDFARGKCVLDVDWYRCKLERWLDIRLSLSAGEAFLHFAIIDVPVSMLTPSIWRKLTRSLVPGGRVFFYTPDGAAAARIGKIEFERGKAQDRKSISRHEAFHMNRILSVQYPSYNTPDGAIAYRLDYMPEWEYVSVAPAKYKEQRSLGDVYFVGYEKNFRNEDIQEILGL